MTGLPQSVSSTLPPSMSVVNPLRGSATAEVRRRELVLPAVRPEPGSSCDSIRKLRASTGSELDLLGEHTEVVWDLALSTRAAAPKP